MNLSKDPKLDRISHKDCTLKLIGSSMVSGKLNVTVRLVKTPPVLSGYKPNDFQFQSTHKKFEKTKMFQDPSDFIEPELLTKEFMSTNDNEQNDLCETVPIMPKKYTIRPSVALRDTLRRNLKRKTQPVRVIKKGPQLKKK